MILRNTKIVKNRQDIMAESEEVNIDSQMDITQKSDREVEDNSQIIEKITSAYSANKDMLNMMHTMFSHLEEKLIENQEKISNSLEGKLRENQEKMNSLEEKLLENQGMFRGKDK